MVDIPKFSETCNRCEYDCCNRTGGIPLEYPDLILLSQFLDLTVKQVKQMIVNRNVSKWKSRTFVSYMMPFPCPFSMRGRCRIDAAKPFLCWVYPFVILYDTPIMLNVPCLFVDENKDKYIYLDNWDEYREKHPWNRLDEWIELEKERLEKQ